MKNLRREDLSLNHYIKNYALQDFIEEEKDITLSYLSSESSPPTSYVYEINSTMEPLPTSKGRGLAYIDNPSDVTEQSNQVTVYDSEGVVISGSNYNIDYIDGRVIVASSAIVPAAIDYKWHYVALVDEWPVEESSELPIVVVDISRTAKRGFQLGGGKFVSRSVFLHIFAFDASERDDIVEALYNGLYLKSCAYQIFTKGTMIDWDGRFNSDYEYTTISGSSNLKFDNVVSENITSPLMSIVSNDYTQLTNLRNKFRNRISFDLIHWEEA